MIKDGSRKKAIYSTLAPGEKAFSTFDVSRILNINRERLRQWAKLGFIVEGGRVVYKAGYKTVWGVSGLYGILAFKRLVDAGVRRSEAASWKFGSFGSSLMKRPIFGS